MWNHFLQLQVGYQDQNMDIEFRELGTVEISDLVELMNNPLVRRHMPLSNDNITLEKKQFNRYLLEKPAYSRHSQN